MWKPYGKLPKPQALLKFGALIHLRGSKSETYQGGLHPCSQNNSLTLREERRLRVFENRVLRGVFGPERDEVTGNGENYIMRSLMICTPYPILCGW
jgi:hypothetical protein